MKKRKTLADLVMKLRPGTSREEACKIADILSTCRSSLISRCCNPENKDYHLYGDRGITVCADWLDPVNGSSNFVEWALTNGWKPGLSIDRRDNDLGYGPENCRWASGSEQSNNTRRSTSMEIMMPRQICRELTGCNGSTFSGIWKRGPEAVRESIIHHRGLRLQHEEEKRDNIRHGLCPFCGVKAKHLYRSQSGEIVGCDRCIRKQDIFSAAVEDGLI